MNVTFPDEHRQNGGSMGQAGDWRYPDEDGRGGGPAAPPNWQQQRGDPYRPHRNQPPPQAQHPQAYPRPQFTPQAPPPQPPSVRPPKPKGPSGFARAGCGTAALAVAGCLVWLGVSIYGSSGDGTPASVPAVTSSAQAAAAAKAKAKITAEANACSRRPAAAGDFYLRSVSPGSPWTAQELGDEYGWDYATGKCLSGEQLMMAAAPQGAGQCTQEGLVSENPGYDANATPAPELREVDNETGAAC